MRIISIPSVNWNSRIQRFFEITYTASVCCMTQPNMLDYSIHLPVMNNLIPHGLLVLIKLHYALQTEINLLTG
jgi:hypothetical protein